MDALAPHRGRQALCGSSREKSTSQASGRRQAQLHAATRLRSLFSCLVSRNMSCFCPLIRHMRPPPQLLEPYALSASASKNSLHYFGVTQTIQDHLLKTKQNTRNSVCMSVTYKCLVLEEDRRGYGSPGTADVDRFGPPVGTGT